MKSHSRSSAAMLLAGLAILAASGPISNAQSNPAADRPDEGRVRSGTTSPATPPAPADSLTRAAPESAPPPQADRFAGESTRFKALDTDSDGRISRAEFTLAPNQPIVGDRGTTTGERSTTIKKPWWSRKDPEQNASGTTDSKIGTRTNAAELFQQLDTDRDGFLSRAELAAESQQGEPK